MRVESGAQQHGLAERGEGLIRAFGMHHTYPCVADFYRSLADSRAVNRTPPICHGARRRYDKKLEPVLRARRRVGRHMPVMNVIPPGLDFSNLKARSHGCFSPWDIGFRDTTCRS